MSRALLRSSSSSTGHGRRFELLQVVRTRRAVPEYGLQEGEVGTVVELFDAEEPAYLVEFADEHGRTRELAELTAEQIDPAPPSP